MNEFFKGISLPQPDTLEPLEIKIPKESQKDPTVLEFLKVQCETYIYADIVK